MSGVATDSWADAVSDWKAPSDLRRTVYYGISFYELVGKDSGPMSQQLELAFPTGDSA
jgi:hypothetical protein